MKAPEVSADGWLLDVYAVEDGARIWFLDQDGGRRCFETAFPVTFYAGGPAVQLRKLARFLHEAYGLEPHGPEQIAAPERRAATSRPKPKGGRTPSKAAAPPDRAAPSAVSVQSLRRKAIKSIAEVEGRQVGVEDRPFVSAARGRSLSGTGEAGKSKGGRTLSKAAAAAPLSARLAARKDLFAGQIPVLAITLAAPAALPQVFRRVAAAFPDLEYYDADLPLSLRFAHRTGVFPLLACRLWYSGSRLYKIAALESRWDVQLALPPLRVLRLRPDCDPFYHPPSAVTATIGPHTRRIPAADARLLLWGIGHLLKRFDPDLILTDYGDTWLFPRLIEASEAHRLPFNPGRDPQRPYQRRGAFSYHTYGRIAHRGAQVHLYGRFHVDHMNATMYRQTGLHGIIEVTRLSGLPLQDVARKSPGAGITAMQMLIALEDDVLVPYEKAQVEDFKTPQELVRADRGGLVGQPVTGLHGQVAGIDFFSMYAQAMAHFNISPEKIAWRSGPGRTQVPGLGVYVDRRRPGLVPRTVGPILDKRWAIKEQLAKLDRRDCRYEPLKSYATALKWLLLVGFGYMGYKRFRWGRVEAHEAVTAFGRQVLLQAKEMAEALGYDVLYFNVDGLYVQKAGGAALEQEELARLLDRIRRRTGLRIALDQVFEWIAFLPSRLDARVPVANRYFGVSRGPHGEAVLKIRGLAQRRHDTPEWVSEAQLAIMGCMSRAGNAAGIADRLPAIVDLVRARLRELEAGRVPRRSLLASQVLSRELAAYRSPSPGARAALQLQRRGRTLSPGQKVKFWYTRTPDGVTADGLDASGRAPIDTKRYRVLLLRAVDDLLQPLGVDEATMQIWLQYGYGRQRAPRRLGTRERSWALPLENWG